MRVKGNCKRMLKVTYTGTAGEMDRGGVKLKKTTKKQLDKTKKNTHNHGGKGGRLLLG